MCNERQIDRRQHGLAWTVVEDLGAEHDLLGALRRDGQAKVVDTMHRFSRCIAAVKRKRRKSCYMITGAVSVTLDSARQEIDCWHSGNLCAIVLIHGVYFPQAFSPGLMTSEPVAGNSSTTPLILANAPLNWANWLAAP